jgi:hypothetical protein
MPGIRVGDDFPAKVPGLVNHKREFINEKLIDALNAQQLPNDECARFAGKSRPEYVATLVQLKEVTSELLARALAEEKVEGKTILTNTEESQAKEEQAEPTGQDVSKASLSKMLKSKLTNAEEENERLRVQLDAAMATAEGKVDGSTFWANKEGNQAKEAHLAPTGQDISKTSLSKMLKMKLTNAEEENERLQAHLDAVLKELAIAQEATVTDAAMMHITRPEPEMEKSPKDAAMMHINRPEPEMEKSPKGCEPRAMETLSTWLQKAMEDDLQSETKEQIRSVVALCPQQRYEVTPGFERLHATNKKDKIVLPFLNLSALPPLSDDEHSALSPCSLSLSPSSSQEDLSAWSVGSLSPRCSRGSLPRM